MQFPESWLREFCNPPLTTQALADLLTMSGMEVEELQPVAPPFSKIVVGEILEAVQHPNADKLNACTVSIGAAEPLQIVCGASNVRAGIHVAVATVGSYLPAVDLTIKPAELRGVASSGLLREVLSWVLPALVAADASALYARNVLDFLKLVVTKEGTLTVPLDDDIVAACRVTQDGQVTRA